MILSKISPETSKEVSLDKFITLALYTIHHDLDSEAVYDVLTDIWNVAHFSS